MICNFGEILKISSALLRSTSMVTAALAPGSGHQDDRLPHSLHYGRASRWAGGGAQLTPGLQLPPV